MDLEGIFQAEAVLLRLWWGISKNESLALTKHSPFWKTKHPFQQSTKHFVGVSIFVFINTFPLCVFFLPVSKNEKRVKFCWFCTQGDALRVRHFKKKCSSAQSQVSPYFANAPLFEHYHSHKPLSTQPALHMHFRITCSGKNNCKNNQGRWKHLTQQISNTLEFLIQSFTRYFVVHQI